jgi:hypothetical protein
MPTRPRAAPPVPYTNPPRTRVKLRVLSCRSRKEPTTLTCTRRRSLSEGNFLAATRPHPNPLPVGEGTLAGAEPPLSRRGGTLAGPGKPSVTPPERNPGAVADCPFRCCPIRAIIPIDGVAEHRPSAPSEGLCQSHCVWRSGVLAPAALGSQPTVNPGHTCLQPARLPGPHQRHLFPLRLICSPQLFDSGRRISGRGWWATVGVVFSASVSVFFEEWQLCRRVRSRS